MNYTFILVFVLILVVILVIGSLYFNFQNRELSKEEFYNLEKCSINYPRKISDYGISYRFVDSKISKISNNNFNYKDFDNNFKDIFLKYLANMESLEELNDTNNKYSADLSFSVGSTSKIGKTIEMIFNNFEHQPLIRITYNIKDNLVKLIDYTNGIIQEKKWNLKYNWKTGSNYPLSVTIMIDRDANGSWKGQLLIRNNFDKSYKCYSLTDVYDFLDQLKYIEINTNPKIIFKVICANFVSVYGPKKPPLIDSYYSNNFELLKDGIMYGDLYRPKGPDGYYSLGEYGFRNDNTKAKQMLDKTKGLMLKKGEYVKSPKFLEWKWDNIRGHDENLRKTLYKQMSFKENNDEFECLGDYYKVGDSRKNHQIRNDGENDYNHPHVCISKQCLEIPQNGNKEPLRTYHDVGSGSLSFGSLWTHYFTDSSSDKTSNKIGYPGHTLLSFNNSYYKIVPDSPWRRSIIKKSCLEKRDPIKIDSDKVLTRVNYNLSVQNDIYKNKVANGLAVLAKEGAQLRENGLNIAKNERKNADDRINEYEETTNHNNEMNKRKKETLNRIIFLKTIKNNLNNSSKNQNSANIYFNKTDLSRKKYNQELNKNSEFISKNNNIRNKEAQDAITNINMASNLKMTDIRKPSDSFTLYPR